MADDSNDAGFQDFLKNLSMPDSASGDTPTTAPTPDSYTDFQKNVAPPPSAVPPTPAPTPVFSGSILPLTKYSDNSVGFDSNAGVVGLAKRTLGDIWSGFTLPRDVVTGKVDPESQEGMERALQLAAIATPMSVASRAGEGFMGAALPGVVPKVAAPSVEALRSASSMGYDAARDMGVEYSSPSVADMAAKVQGSLNDRGMLAPLAPQTHAILDKLQSVPDGSSSVPLSSLDAARRAFGHAAGTFTNPTEQLAAKHAQNDIDDFVANPDPANVVAGPAAAAGKVISDARANYAAAARSSRINGIEDAGELQAAAANSGANGGNAIRQRTKSILLNPKAIAGYNPEETAALRSVVMGTTPSNLARRVGNMAGGGGGWGSAMTGLASSVVGGQTLGTPGAILGAAVPFIGQASKHIDNALTAGRLQAADEMVRQRSPLYNWRKASASPELPPDATRMAPVRAGTVAAQPPVQEDGTTAVQPSTYAAGGSVKKRMTHEQLVQRLLDLAEKAKKATNEDTKPLLKVPDEAVVKALAVAQQAI